MNRRQEIALFVIVVPFVATWLFPPWLNSGFIGFSGEYHQGLTHAGYGFLFTSSNDLVDLRRLLLEDLMIAVVGGWLLYTLRSKS